MIYFLKTGGRYKWVDNWLLSYTTWGRDEPKNNYGCVYMDVDTKWKTAPCTNTYYSLCKRSPGQTILLLVLLHDILHVSKSYGRLSVQSLFQMWLPLSPLNSLETVQNQRSKNPGYLSEAIVIPFTAQWWTSGPMPQLNV